MISKHAQDIHPRTGFLLTKINGEWKVSFEMHQITSWFQWDAAIFINIINLILIKILHSDTYLWCLVDAWWTQISKPKIFNTRSRLIPVVILCIPILNFDGKKQRNCNLVVYHFDINKVEFIFFYKNLPQPSHNVASLVYKFVVIWICIQCSEWIQI